MKFFISFFVCIFIYVFSLQKIYFLKENKKIQPPMHYNLSRQEHKLSTNKALNQQLGKKDKVKTPPLREGLIAIRNFNMMLFLKQWMKIVHLPCIQTINHKSNPKKIL